MATIEKHDTITAVLYGLAGIIFWVSMKFLPVAVVMLSWIMLAIIITIRFRPVYAICLLLLCLLNDIPRDIFGGFTVYTIEGILASIMVGWGRHVLEKREMVSPGKKYVLAWAMFFFAILLSFFKSVSYGASIKYLVHYIEIGLVYLFAYDAVRGRDDLLTIVNTLLSVSAIIAVVAIFQYIHYDHNYLRVQGTLYHHNTLGGFLLFGIFMGLSAVTGAKSRLRILYIMVVMLCFIALKFSFSRGAWVGLCGGGVMYIIYCGSRKIRIWLSAALIAGIVVLIVFNPASTRQRVTRIWKNYTSNYSDNISIRIELAKQGFAFVKQSPLLGIGAGNYALQEQYSDSGEINYYMKGGLINYYLQLMVETGILGLTAFLFMIIMHMRMIIVSLRPDKDAAVFHIVLAGMGSALFGFLIHVNFERLLNIHFMGILFGLVLGVSTAVCRLKQCQGGISD